MLGLDNLQPPDVSAYSEERAMEEPVRWVSKAEAAEELEISPSTLDRMVRRGEAEVRREGRRVYVRMEGPEYVTDEELLRRAVAREDELQRTVRELEQSVSEWQLRASELERERMRPGSPLPPPTGLTTSLRGRTGRRSPSTRRRRSC